MIKHIYLIHIVLFAFLTSCKGQTENDSVKVTATYSLPIDTSFVPTDSTEFYFPLDLFQDTSLYVGHDTFLNSWYSKHLFAMREPIFYADKSQNETYRFTWLRTFHNPIAIRVEKRGDSYMLYWKLCDGAGGYKPGKLIIDKQKKIDRATWDEFKKHLSQMNFWNIKTNETELWGTDGSQWILEGKTSKQYHFVDRWTPDEESRYYRCCDFLIGLTDLTIKSRDKY